MNHVPGVEVSFGFTPEGPRALGGPPHKCHDSSSRRRTRHHCDTQAGGCGFQARFAEDRPHICHDSITAIALAIIVTNKLWESRHMVGTRARRICNTDAVETITSVAFSIVVTGRIIDSRTNGGGGSRDSKRYKEEEENVELHCEDVWTSCKLFKESVCW
ncbi:uncharacterized protein BJX67DRAFT_111075 [Aspergillus lucknowensis]|uniref:Uncharacterized protein n=1 Tax=Aspergillus lucknowensis TaxID=176173 RepID=A0ABR4LR49_9EURO